MAIKISELFNNKTNPISILHNVFARETISSGEILSLSAKLYQLAADKWKNLGTIDIWGKVNDKGGTAGPMVGYVTATEANIWAWGGVNPKFRLQYRRKGDQVYSGPVDMNPNPSLSAINYRSVRGVLKKLNPDTTYEYICYLEGARERFEKFGQFRTAPLSDTVPASFKVAISSCMRRRDDKIQYAVNYIFDQHPDLQFIIGDSVYYDDQADERDPKNKDGIFSDRNKWVDRNGSQWNYGESTTGRRLKGSWYWQEWFWSYHIRQRAIPSFARNLRNIPTCSTWDDHDYGDDNKDDNFAGMGRDGGEEIINRIYYEPVKRYTRAVFDDMWCNPGNAGSEGIYYILKWGAEVEFFVLDGRTHLNKATNEMFGHTQLVWLFDKLNESTAKFKILITGSIVKKWRKFNGEFNAIKGILNGINPSNTTKKGKKIDGVIIITGDIHRCDLREHGKSHADEAKDQYDFGTPYTIYEVISSGIATPFHHGDDGYFPRKEAFVFVTLTFTSGAVVIDYHRHPDAFSRYKEWLSGLSDSALDQQILVGQGKKYDEDKILDAEERKKEREFRKEYVKRKRDEWIEMASKTIPSPHRSQVILATSLINAISVQDVAENKVSGSFRILSDLLKKGSTASLYAELDQLR